jgi:hypothetical protein
MQISSDMKSIHIWNRRTQERNSKEKEKEKKKENREKT